MKYWVATILIFVLIYAYTSFAADTDIFTSGKAEKIDKFVSTAPIFLNCKSVLNVKLSDVKKLVKINKEYITKSANKYNKNKIDEFLTLQFDGLEIYGYLKSPSELWLIHVTITSHRWGILYGLIVGSDASRISQYLGTPVEQKKNMKIYYGESERVEFSTEGNRISKVELFYYMD